MTYNDIRIVSLLAAAMMTTGMASARAESVWDMPSIYPAGSFHVVNVMTPFAEEVKKATNGELVIKVQPGGALGIAGTEMMAAVRDGIVKIADLSPNLSSGYEPILALLGLPLLADDFEQLAVLDKHFRPKVDEIAAKYNQKILTNVPWPPQYLHVKKQVSSVEELRGVKIRTSTRNEEELFRAVGLAPVLLPWGEVVPALASGAIEGVVTSTSSGVDANFWEFLTIAYPTNHVWNTQFISVNLDAWNGLKPEHREAILKIAETHQPRFWDLSKQEDIDRAAILKQHGYTIADHLPTGLGDALRKSAAPMIRDFMDKNPGAREIIEAYLKEIGRTL